MSVAQAMSLAGDEHGDYVSVRTRSEVAWLRLVSEWFAEQADRLDGELAAAHSVSRRSAGAPLGLPSGLGGSVRSGPPREQSSVDDRPRLPAGQPLNLRA